MEAFEKLEEICRAMSDPAFYPHPVSRLERIDTHISTVFLTGQWVYKLKKPVDFGFLDFTGLDARRYFCEQEVRLNQRLSRGVYVGVVEITRDAAGRFLLEGAGEVVEYAVKMRQLPEEANLKSILKRGASALADMKDLGLYLADFYESSERNDEIDSYGPPDVISFNMEENFQQMEPFVGEFVPREQWEFIRQVSRAFFRNWRGLFDRRVEGGRIRDGHGDLRAQHVYFFEGIQIIDCIEFNNRFRYGDVVADLAFLHMDLEHLGHRGLSQTLLSAYVEKSNDPELYTLLDFYAAYRAIVKVKVNCLRSTEVEDEGERAILKAETLEYLKQAYRYAVQFSRPTLWIFCGLPATGKSAMASRMADALSLDLFQSDRIRKEFEGLQPSREVVVPYDEGIYRRERRNLIYARMLALAQERLKAGHSVILDASFSLRKWRNDAKQLAEDLGTNFIAVECVASEGAIRERLELRDREPGASDARLQHLPAMIENFEPLTEASFHSYIRLDTERRPQQLLVELLADSHARKCGQVGEIVGNQAWMERMR